MWTIGKNVLVTVNQSKHALYLRDLFGWGGGTQVKTFKFIEEVHNCPAVRDVSSKNKKTRMDFVQTFLFLHRFLFFLFSSVSLFYASATSINKSSMLQITVCCDLTRVWRVKERVWQLFEVFQHEFATLSLPCQGRFRDSFSNIQRASPFRLILLRARSCLYHRLLVLSLPCQCCHEFSAFVCLSLEFCP